MGLAKERFYSMTSFFLLLIYLGYTSPLDSHFVSKAGDLLSKLFGMPKLVLIKMVFYVEV